MSRISLILHKAEAKPKHSINHEGGMLWVVCTKEGYWAVKVV